jgi:hypothetical protein
MADSQFRSTAVRSDENVASAGSVGCRIAFAYVGTILAPLPFLLLPAPDAPWSVRLLLAAVVGLIAGIAFEDHRRGTAPHNVFLSMSIAYWVCGALLIFFVAARELAFSLLFPPYASVRYRWEWLPYVLVLLSAPLLAAIASEIALRRMTQWFSRLVEGAACLLGVFALAVVLRQALVVFCLVTLGPLTIGRAGWSVLGAFGSLPSYASVGAFAISVTPAAGFLWLRTRSRLSPRVAAGLVQVVLGLALLGYSYRFTALAAIFGVLIAQWYARPSDRSRQLMLTAWVLIIVLCFLPLDVSLQAFPGRPHLAPAVSGLLTGSAFTKAGRGEVVIVGYCDSLYDEPRWVWVW